MIFNRKSRNKIWSRTCENTIGFTLPFIGDELQVLILNHLVWLKAPSEIFKPPLHIMDIGEMKHLPHKPSSRGPEKAYKLAEKASFVQTHGYIWIPPTL
ncbi:glucose-6-phosphate 1-dehydrogenase 6, cytoplasmic-like isoform X2 [Rutidosis leptorrhynchoides]|uniref:glucose-6-phosphate 1-dehydrogenase 6, cytoplasmic-like isoform X2 n=1 Tax=Rutidosis leptorrhynchoides TaxID=125765 RepID=UPI003A999826